MALGEFRLFTWKSKAAQEKEQEEYEKWAFPFGQQQRENLEALLKAIFPKGSDKITLVQFLTCKELYEGALKKADQRDAAIIDLISNNRNYRQIIRKKEMPTFIAIVIADAEIDEQCQYPEADAILASAQEIESLRKRK
jgi:hypothetical protein